MIIYGDQPKFRRKKLVCGCCGEVFQTWPEYKDQDQDKGFGCCKVCQAEEIVAANKALDDGAKKLRASLSEKNQRAWDGLDVGMQRAIVRKAIEDGVMKFTIGGAP
jgi:hypothetical protein